MVDLVLNLKRQLSLPRLNFTDLHSLKRAERESQRIFFGERGETRRHLNMMNSQKTTNNQAA